MFHTIKDLITKLGRIGKNAPKTMDAFQEFDAAAMSDGAIPVKYKELIAIGVALTTQCVYCLEIHKDKAKKAGATEQEISEAIFVAAVLRAGAAITHGSHLIED